MSCKNVRALKIFAHLALGGFSVKYSILTLCGILLLGWSLASIEMPLVGRTTDSPSITSKSTKNEPLTKWRRSVDGWECVTDWNQLGQPPSVYPKSARRTFLDVSQVHPSLVALFLGLAGLGACLCLPEQTNPLEPHAVTGD